MVNVLFIDDDPQAHRTLELVLPEQYALISAYTAKEGIEAARREPPDLVLLDINLPDADGITVLRQIASRPAAPPVIMLTAMSHPSLVKEAILGGACDYVVKPYELPELLGTMRTALAGSDARRAAASASVVPPSGELVGESAVLQEVRELIVRYAPSDSPVLVLGESGTGKELVAREIHEASRRRDGPCVAINCGALPDALLETELFGSEKGAFTDAVTRPGAFEQANGGTLFLDEIGELSPQAQTRLLRVIEHKQLTRLGGTRVVPLDVRVISATNRELGPRTEGAGFRMDLFYRLSVLPIRVPPLRARSEDVPVLAVHFLCLLGRAALRIEADAREKLCSHPWPGNVRELRNVMERASLSARNGSIRARDLVFD
jgi:DNA-binding NtrC family response regulator